MPKLENPLSLDLKVRPRELREKCAVLERHLTSEAIEDFASHRTYAVVVKDFIKRSQARRMARVFLSRKDRIDYTHEAYSNGRPIQISYGVDRIGEDFPYNLTYRFPLGDPIFDKYYASVARSMRTMDEASYPDTNPILRLRRELNRCYVSGAAYAEWDKGIRPEAMLAGICRITRPNAKILADQPHADSLPPRNHLADQWSANVYLSVPPEGGELEVWDREPFTQAEIASFEESKIEIQGTSVCIKPEAGDLILINSRRAHAVREFQEGTRVSVASFIAVLDGKPLLLWT